ncbi:muscleblind-like protein 1 isoform X6 [Panulirus ornatus]|uniref:muscleblind-like protein 1 isoform X6 n=1 Tax=Panulirus ornatus TaxID=150431 RepID=UPI003A860E8A
MVSAGVPNMAMVNVNNFLNVKDSRWLQLEVCREFQRNKCTRPDTECKFAHPPPNVEVQNGRVTACYDSIKGRCNREKPPCKYFHPPQHLKDQLLINGRNHLALKNAIMTQIQGLSPGTPVVPGTIPIIQQPYYPCYHQSPHGRPQEQRPSAHYSLNNTSIPPENLPIMFPQHNSAPYLAGIPTMGNFNPYIASSPVMTMGVTDGAVASPITGVVPQQVVPAQKVPRTDRLEVCREFQRGACKRAEQECRFAHPPDHVSTTDEGTVTVCMDAIKSRCSRDPCRYFHPPPHLQAQLRASQGRAAQQPLPGSAVAAAAAAVPLAPPPPLPAAAAAAAAAAELGKKRGRDPSDELLMAFPGMGVPYKRPAGDKSGVPVYQPTGSAAYQQALMQQLGGQSFVPVSSAILPNNATSVVYTDENGQLLDTLQVCRDFKYGQCVRPACKFVHLLEDHVEVTDMKVSVCRDAVKGKCGRGLCKYYHLPVVLPPAPLDPHSARTQSAPRHHNLHNPPINSLILDNAHYMDNTTPAPPPNNNNDPATPGTTSTIQVIANLTSSNNILCN